MRSYRPHRRWRPFGEAIGKTSKSISPIPTREGCGGTTRALEYLGADHPAYICSDGPARQLFGWHTFLMVVQLIASHLNEVRVYTDCGSQPNLVQGQSGWSLCPRPVRSWRARG